MLSFASALREHEQEQDKGKEAANFKLRHCRHHSLLSFPAEAAYRKGRMKNLLRIVFATAALAAGYTWLPWHDWMPKAAGRQLSQESMKSLVFVEGEHGKGSGFVCDIQGKKFVLTNQHVIAGNPGAKFTLIDQSPIRTGQAAAAVGHDIMSFALLSDAKALEMMTEVEKNAAIGDEVAVLGNSDGDRVIKPLMGKLVGIGPDRVEVTAEFVHGNSGSPIVHVKSGKVIGVATFATIRKLDSITGAPRDRPEVKRFGFRLDSVRQWQPVNWPAYNAEFLTLEKIGARTNELIKLLMARQFTPSEYSDPAIRGPLERFANAAKGSGLIKADKLSAAKDLAISLRNACDADIAQAQAQVRYDHFRQQLGEQQKLRAEFYKVFAEVRKRLPN